MKKMFLSIDLVEYIYENDKMSFGCILLIIFEFFFSFCCIHVSLKRIVMTIFTIS